MPAPRALPRRVLFLLSATAPPVAVTAIGVTPSAAGGPAGPVARHVAATTTSVATTTSTTTSTTSSTTTTQPPLPTPSASTALPPYGHASAYGCTAALAYLRAYAAPGFSLSCPGDALGHEGMSCYSEAPCAPGQKMIAIADACPAAYMNEAHNSWVLVYEVDGTPVPDGNTSLDPYGAC